MVSLSLFDWVVSGSLWYQVVMSFECYFDVALGTCLDLVDERSWLHFGTGCHRDRNVGNLVGEL